MLLAIFQPTLTEGGLLFLGFLAFSHREVAGIISKRKSKQRGVGMVLPRIDLEQLKLRQHVLLAKLDELIANEALSAEIKHLIGADFSLKALWSKSFGKAMPISEVAVDNLRRRLSIKASGALATFDELISVCREFRQKDNPLIVS